MEREKQRVTLKMIAQAAGTSIGTVDRALNNRPGVSEKSKQHILKVSQELGYQPNMFASALSRRKDVRIGLVYPSAPTEFYADIESGIAIAREELKDYGVILEEIRYDMGDGGAFSAALESLHGSLFDGLAVNSAGAQNVSAIDELVDTGIPVITFNTDVAESKRLFYVGGDSLLSGRMGGELLSLLLGGQGNVTVLGNFSRPFVGRLSGFCEYLQTESPGIQVFPCLDSRGDSASAAEVLENILQRIPDINGLFCTGYSSTISAAQTLQKLNQRDIALIGYDVTACTGQALLNGWCKALLYQAPRRQGYMAARLLVRYLLEGWQPDSPRQYVDTRIVLKSNLQTIEKGRDFL